MNNLILKVLDETSALKVLDFIQKDSELFEQYEVKHQSFFYTESFQANILKNEYIAYTNHGYLRFYVFLKDDPDTIIGTVSFGNILPDPYKSCTIGYKFSSIHHNKGYAKEALKFATSFAFDYLSMHKINAFVLPDNIPSIKVLEANNFHQEGYCIKHLKINNIWKDHLLYSLIKED